MTALPVAPVIPTARLGRGRQDRPGPGRPMPLAGPSVRPGVVYGGSTIAGLCALLWFVRRAF